VLALCEDTARRQLFTNQEAEPHQILTGPVGTLILNFMVFVVVVVVISATQSQYFVIAARADISHSFTIFLAP
jgi:hypothetical protein